MKSARINFGQPNTEYKLEINEAGEATSCYNQDTDTEYIGGGGGGYLDMQALAINITNTKDGEPVSLEDFELYGTMQIYPLQSNQIDISTLLTINNGSIEIAKIENQTTRLKLDAYIESSGQMIDTESTTYEGSITADPDEPDHCIVSGPGTIHAVWVSAD